VDAPDLVPRGRLAPVRRLAADHGHLRGRVVAGEDGQRLRPKVEDVDRRGGIRGAEGVEKRFGEPPGLGLRLTRRGLDVEQIGHGSS
jgi:hypothetical protein